MSCAVSRPGVRPTTLMTAVRFISLANELGVGFGKFASEINGVFFGRARLFSLDVLVRLRRARSDVALPRSSNSVWEYCPNQLFYGHENVRVGSTDRGFAGWVRRKSDAA